MFRKLAFFPVVAILLGLPCPSWAQRSGAMVIPETTVRRHGLTRAWFAQVAVDRSSGHLVHITQQGGMLFVQTDQAMVHALDAETGRTLWAVQVGRRGHPSMAPAANDDFVAVVNGSMLYVVDRKDGKLKWARQVGASPGAGAALSATHVFVPMVNGAVEGYLLKDETEPVWVFRSDGRALTQPMITPKTVSWTTDKGYLYVGSTAQVGIRFRLQTRAAIESRPAYWTPYLYAGSLDGYVYAVDEKSGLTEWKFSTAEPLSQPPVAIDGLVYVVSESGGMFCLQGRNGSQEWFAQRIKQFIAASPTKVYACDYLNRLVILDGKTGARQDLMPLPEISLKMINAQTDRIFLATETGLVQCLHEVGLPTPVVYTPPEDRDETIIKKKTAKETTDESEAAEEEPVKKKPSDKKSDEEGLDENPDKPDVEKNKPEEDKTDDNPFG
jgi:hypothetical protein